MGFDKIILVNDTDHPTQEIINELIEKKYISEKIMSGEWYGVLREWQGIMKPYMEYDYPYMTDGSNYFPTNQYEFSDIEYVYIINLDEEGSFITMRSFMKDPFKISLKDLNNMSNDEYYSKLEIFWN